MKVVLNCKQTKLLNNDHDITFFTMCFLSKYYADCKIGIRQSAHALSIMSVVIQIQESDSEITVLF